MRTHAVLDSPLGALTAVAENGALSGLYFERHRPRPAAEAFGGRDDAAFAEVRDQLGAYFAGERRTFDLAVAPRGDDFDLRVWGLLAGIPYGRTRSYGDLARELGDAAPAQAVGAALGRNPLCVIVPCHRVVGANGALTGYAGGLDRKRFLLDLEAPPPAESGRLF